MNKLAQELIEKHEGRRNKLYQDTEGVWTIGVGYNIQEHGLPDWIIDRLLSDMVALCEIECAKLIPSFYKHNELRRAVLIDMMFNLGYTRFSTFKKMLKALEEATFDPNKYSYVTKEMLDSKWALQVKGRANELAKHMLKGKL